MSAIAATIETRDPYTGGHQSRVAELSVAIGRKMGLDEDRLLGLQLGAMIHDIGKIYVPAEILNRPGKLNEAQFALVKSHVEIGHDIASRTDFPWPIADMILQHHEHVDGSGYPNGLKGEDILLEARILRVADTAEALSSHRPYRLAMSVDEVVAELRKCAGNAYDAKVVDICVDLLGSGGFAFDSDRTAMAGTTPILLTPRKDAA